MLSFRGPHCVSSPNICWSLIPGRRILEIEQRRSARKILQTKAVFVIDGKAPCIGRTADISATGVGLLLPNPLSAGLQGRVAFDMYFNGKLHAFRVEAKVMHCVFGAGAFKIGLLFVRLDLPSTTAISEYLR
jgi:c-di-GMP-binding flagellar brake protein YcgR